MTRKTKKSLFKRYTAKFVPRTIKATRNTGKYTVGKIDVFLRGIFGAAKNLTRSIDKSVSRTIRSLTRKQRK
jgi:hypothetical protein